MSKHTKGGLLHGNVDTMPTITQRVIEHEYLDVLCWCQRDVVSVKAANVLAGYTQSCGAKGCCETKERG